MLDAAPRVPAIVPYLAQYNPAFAGFAAARGLTAPYHVTFTPALLQEFGDVHGDVWVTQVRDYAGQPVGRGQAEGVAGTDALRLGSQPIEHWNSYALSDGEFRTAYKETRRCSAGSADYALCSPFPTDNPGSPTGLITSRSLAS